MTTKPNRFSKLSSSVETQKAAASDKFARASIVLAAQSVTEGIEQIQNPELRESSNDISSINVNDERVLTLKIEDVLDHPRNARKLYDEERLDSVGKSIARDGQQIPAIVMKHPTMPGKYLLIEGRYRKKAIISLGKQTIKALEIEPVSELEAYRISRMLNEERTQQTELDDALSWQEMLDNRTYTSQEHICEHLGVSTSRVSKILAMLKLPHVVLSIMKTKPSKFGIRISYELVQLSKIIPEKELEAIAEKIGDGNMTVAEVEALREKKEKPTVTRERSRAYPLTYGKTSFGKINEFDDGRLNINLVDASESLRNSIKEAVQRILEDEAKKINP